MSNRFKPRYKKCYQVRNKIWINKNSKLRGFYILRKLQHTRFRKKKLKSMKWNIVRRFLLPRRQNRTYSKFRYKTLFQNKQKLKYFYGKIKEYQLQYIFQTKWVQQKAFKQNIFIGTLEQRLDVVLYRVKLLPTIFASHQLISHQGVYVNNNLITTVNYKLKCGDIISLSPDHWSILYDRLHDKLIKRSHGHKILTNQVNKKLGTLNKFDNKKKPIRYNFQLLYEYYKVKAHFIKLKQVIKNYDDLNIYSTEDLGVLNDLFNNKIQAKFNKINLVLLPILKKWRSLNYYKAELEVILTLLSIQKFINKIIYINKLKYITVYYNKKSLNYVKGSKEFIINNKIKNYLLFKNYESYNEHKQQLKQVAQILLFKGTFLKVYKKNELKNSYKSKTYKEALNPSWKKTPSWYIPNYLEVDYKTLRISFLYHPSNNEVFYPFYCSFDDIVTFYKNTGMK